MTATRKPRFQIPVEDGIGISRALIYRYLILADLDHPRTGTEIMQRNHLPPAAVWKILRELAADGLIQTSGHRLARTLKGFGSHSVRIWERVMK